MHKTGSSSIQASLFAAGGNAFFRYADLGRPNHSEPVYSLFADKPREYHIHRKRGRDGAAIDHFNEANRRRLAGFFQRDASPTVVLSGEDILLLSPSGLQRLRDFLTEWFQRIEVAAYVRPPVSYMQSFLQQRVKGGATDLTLGQLYPRYRDRFEKLDRVFGRESVHLWKFEPAEFAGGDLVRDFCHRVGVVPPAGKSRRRNDSLSREALGLLMCYRRSCPGYGEGSRAIRANRLLVEVLMRIGNTPVRFAPSLVRSVLEEHRADLEWMERRLGRSLHEESRDRSGDARSLDELMEVSRGTLAELEHLLGVGQEPSGQNAPEEAARLVRMLAAKLKGYSLFRWRLELQSRFFRRFG